MADGKNCGWCGSLVEYSKDPALRQLQEDSTVFCDEDCGQASMDAEGGWEPICRPDESLEDAAHRLGVALGEAKEKKRFQA